MKMSNNNAIKGTCFLILFASAINGYAQSKYQWKQATEHGYTYRYVTADPMHARFYHLKNGLTVILSVNKKEPRIQTLIGVRAGSNNDPDDHTGLAHYLEHLLFKGTDKYGTLDWAKEKPYIDEIEKLYNTYNHTTDAAARKAVYHQIDSISGIAAHYAIANEYDKLMTEIGAQATNAHTFVEETVFEEDIPSSSLDKYLAVEAERFRYPVFRLFHTELEAVYEEKNRGLDNDGQKVFQVMMNGIFPTHNYGQHTTIGTIEHLKNPSLTAIRNFYNKWYVPNNMAIILSGDIDPAAVIKKINADFAYMQPKPLHEYVPALEAPMKAPVIREVLGPDAESVNIAYRMPGALDSKSQVLLEVLSDMLSNGKAGLLDLNLNQQQKVLNSGAYVQAFKDYSMLVVSGKSKKGQSLDELKDLLQQQIEKIKKGDFDPSLVKAIINNERLDRIRSLENNTSRANELMSAFIKHKGSNWLDDVDFLDQMAKVTKAQLVNFSNQYLGNNYALVYKRLGEDKNIVKVEKPVITPVFINKTAKSPFLDQIAAMPATGVNPLWLDYQKDIQKGQVGQAPMLYVQNKNNALFSLSYRFDMGSWNNKMLPYAADYLHYLGTDKAPAEQLTRAFYNIACDYHISVTGDVTTVNITGLQENFNQAVALFEDLIANCKPDQNAFTALKEGVEKSRENNKLNKNAIVRGMVQYAMYGPKNPFNNQLNNQELNAMTADTLVSLLHSLYNNKHTVIYYGPLLKEQAQTLLIRLHKLPANFSENNFAEKFEKTSQNSNQVLFADYNQVQAEVYWIRNTDVYQPGNTADISVYNKYFGGGMGSVVFQTIRESKALAYSTFAQYVSPEKKEERYSEIGYVGTQADKMRDAISGMNDLFNDMPENEQLLQNSKQSLKQDIATERITNEDIIKNYLAAQRLGLNDDYRKEVYQTIDHITFGDIQKIHNENLKNKTFTYCILGSKDKISADELKKYGEVKKLSLEEIFGY
jgi:predicted Zn-dependent peptidase